MARGCGLWVGVCWGVCAVVVWGLGTWGAMEKRVERAKRHTLIELICKATGCVKGAVVECGAVPLQRRRLPHHKSQSMRPDS